MSLIDRGQCLRFLFSTPNVWFPLATVFFTRLFHLISEDSSTPRLLVLDVSVRGVSSRVYGYSIFLLVACVALMTLHFLGLNLSCHLSCHGCSCMRSCCNFWQSRRDFTDLYITQSSANSRTLDVVCSARSLMKIRKSSAPSTDPCGTPDFTDPILPASSVSADCVYSSGSLICAFGSSSLI